MKKIYTIIAIYNGMKWLPRTMSELQKSQYPTIPILVDNASPDGSVHFIQQNCPEAILLHTGSNLGFGRANNVGIRYALDHGADYVFLLNQDAYIYPETIGKLVDADTDPEIGILSPLQLNGDGSGLDVHFINYVHFTVTPRLVEDYLCGRQIQPWYESSVTNAASWLIPRRTLERIGGFDPFFFHYGEDEHYVQRLRYHGFKMVIVPASHMRHDRTSAGNEALYQKNIDRRRLLKYWLDINLSAGKILKLTLRSLAKDMVTFCGEVTRLDLSHAVAIAGSYCFLLLNFRVMKRNRCINRKSGELNL